MLVTFMRHVVDDKEIIAARYPGVTLEDGMPRQLLDEIEDCPDAPKCRMVKVRVVMEPKEPKEDYYEIVLDFPEYDGQSPVEVAASLQKRLYDEAFSLAGSFQVGDHTF